MLEVQKLYHGAILTGGKDLFLSSLKDLGIDVRDYPEHQFWHLDYNQIEGVKNHPVVNECRGYIMTYTGETVRKGFNRFFNLGENGVETFDFENSITFEKADGSLVMIYYCQATNRWEIGTRGTAFAEGPKEWFGTYRDYILYAMGRSEEQFQIDCRSFDKKVTRVYEVIGPNNRIVTKYEKDMLVALAYVNNLTGAEVVAPKPDIERYDLGWNVREIGQYKFNTQKECLLAVHELSGLQEGYVAYNTKTKERVKIKSPAYLAAHRLRGNGLTMNSVCELVVLNEVDEYLSVFPEDKEKFAVAISLYAEMASTLTVNYDKHKHIETQKDFALAVKDLPMSGVMFKARKNGSNVLHEFNQLPVARRADWLKDQLLELNRKEVA